MKGSFLDAVIKPSDIELKLALPSFCSFPITIIYGEKQHFVVSTDEMQLCDPVILENWESLRQFVKQAEEADTPISWITMHLRCEALKVWSDLPHFKLN